MPPYPPAGTIVLHWRLFARNDVKPPRSDHDQTNDPPRRRSPHLGRHFGMVLRRLARAALSGKIAEERLAPLLRRTIFIRRNQFLVLSHPFGGCGSCLAARHAARFHLRLEGIEVYDALEAAIANLRQLDRADADAAAPARAQA